MSRQPKLRPKSHIPGYPEGLYDLGLSAPIADLENRAGFGDDRREQRVFRVKRKHVLKACDRCRVKKTKCDGKQPCNRCSAYNHPCLFRERKATQTKVYSRGFVEMLESHHSLVVKALQKLYKHCVNKEGFPGDPLVETADGHPLTHAILDRLGLIKQAEENPDEPDEDTEDLQYLRFLSTSTDSSGTSDPSPEPATPPEPTCCNPLHPPPPFPPQQGAGTGWKWGFQTEPYHHHHHHRNYPDTNTYHPVLVSRSSLGQSSLPETPQISPPAAAAAGHTDPSYLYYLDQSPSGTIDVPLKNRLTQQPVLMHGGPSPHGTATGLPVDMLGDYHLPLQEQSMYSGLTPGWHFPSGQ